MKRTLISETPNKIDEKVSLSGFITNLRSHGKLVFADLMDKTGTIQIIGDQKLGEVKLYYAMNIVGKVQKRPESMFNKDLITGEIELQVEDFQVLSAAEEMPFDMGAKSLNLELPTMLDYRALTLKHPTQKSIFEIQSHVAKNFRKAAEDLDCVEVFTPTIAASPTEGGAEVFKIDYYEYPAYLIQSPQLYKQMAVGALERVYLFSHAYRAEPSVTSRHLSEVVQMDCEIAFVESFDELLDALEYVGVNMIKNTFDDCEKKIKEFGVEKPLVGDSVPRLKLKEAQKIVSERTGRDLSHEMDLNPEDEKEICKWAVEEKGSDFVTITHFPTKKRAFYTKPDPEDPEYSLSYDLLFRGLEISSGSMRINEYEKLVEVIKERGMHPENFQLYLQAFKYGMPPEGGFSFGLERITMKLLELDNVRLASMFPRDMERVDVRLSTLHKDK